MYLPLWLSLLIPIKRATPAAWWRRSSHRHRSTILRTQRICRKIPKTMCYLDHLGLDHLDNWLDYQNAVGSNQDFPKTDNLWRSNSFIITGFTRSLYRQTTYNHSHWPKYHLHRWSYHIQYLLKDLFASPSTWQLIFSLENLNWLANFKAKSQVAPFEETHIFGADRLQPQLTFRSNLFRSISTGRAQKNPQMFKHQKPIHFIIFHPFKVFKMKCSPKKKLPRFSPVVRPNRSKGLLARPLVQGVVFHLTERRGREAPGPRQQGEEPWSCRGQDWEGAAETARKTWQ